jgi:hypothetical protein
LGDRVELADEKNVFWGFETRIREISQHLKSHCLLLGFLLTSCFDDLALRFTFLEHFQMFNCFEPVCLLGRRGTSGRCFHILQVIKGVIKNVSMKDSDIHLRAILIVNIGIVYLIEDFKSFFNFSENSVLSGKGGQVGLGESDEKFTVIKIRSEVGRGYKSDLIDFFLNIDLVFEEFDVSTSCFPNGGGVLRSNFGDIVCIDILLLF